MKSNEIEKYVTRNYHNHEYFKNSTAKYREVFIDALKSIASIISDGELESLIKEKLQFEKKYDKKELIQSLCEVTLGYYLIRNFPGSVSYEKNIDPDNGKNVDFQYITNDSEINLEIKCARYDETEKVHKKDGFFLGYWGRHPEYKSQYDFLNSALKEGQEKASVEKVKELFLDKHMDYNILEFLKYMQEKIGKANLVNNYNVLVIGAGDQFDLNKVLGYLIGNQGLFTQQTFDDPNEYNNVDCILLTNMYYKHNRPSSTEDGSSLLFEKTFSLIQLNYLAKYMKQKPLSDFKNSFHHQTDALINFSKEDFAPQEIKIPILISAFAAYKKEYEELF